MEKCVKSQVSNLSLHLNILKILVQSKQKEIIKIIADFNQIEYSKTIEKIDETKGWFFEKINKVNKLLSRLTKKRGTNYQQE